MDVLAHCRAMAAFCRQRVAFEHENDIFWRSEAEEWDKLISEALARKPEPGRLPEAGAMWLNDWDGQIV